MNEPAANPEASIPQALDLRDIHLPEPITWWPIAPGWWAVIASLFLVVIVFFIIKKIHANRQLKRDIKSELETIKQQFQQIQDQSQLAKSLSILLRRASITYYPKTDIAGLTGNDWLAYLDKTNSTSSRVKFQSDIGNILLSAPYLPDNSEMDFDAKALVSLCESWLLSPHKALHKKTMRVQAS
ncbi:MAG: DUF4381 domain-containing protein [Gammaproteobacteria bacterium]|nr:DUF4381 domain-containing protein [Gammaproteobacteria bacterium]